MEPSEVEANFAHWKRFEGGLGAWVAFNGIWPSSTRCETAAALIAMQAAQAVHIASDSKAMVGKARDMQQRAKNELAKIPKKRRGDREGQAGEEYDQADIQHIINKCPFKRAWIRQKDGDLWKQMWQTMVAKSPAAVKYTWVKGHAKQEHIEKGLTTEQHIVGNNNSDCFAGEGASVLRTGWRW